MTKKRTLDPEMIDSVAQNMFYALPLIKKRLLHMDMVQKEHGTPLSHVQVLAMLQDVGTMSVSEISRRLALPSRTSRRWWIACSRRLCRSSARRKRPPRGEHRASACRHGEAVRHPRDHLPPDSDAGGGSFPLRIPRAARFAGKRRSHSLLSVMYCPTA